MCTPKTLKTEVIVDDANATANTMNKAAICLEVDGGVGESLSTATVVTSDKGTTTEVPSAVDMAQYIYQGDNFDIQSDTE